MSKAEKVLRDIEGIARGKRFLPIVGPSKGQILNKVVREAKPKRILEVGALIGYSAILMGKALGKEAHLITIEIDADNAEIAKENIRKAEIPPTVEVLIGDAIEVIPELEGRFDLIFIDAEKAKYLDYLRLIEDKLHRGSIIVADNVARAPTYLDYVRSSGKYSSGFVRVGAVRITQHKDHNLKEGLEISTKL